MIRITVDVFGFDKTLEYLEGVTPHQRRVSVLELQGWGQELVFLAEVLSPKDKLRGKDWRRRPREESFAKSWAKEIVPIPPGDFELLVGNVDPKMPWIIDGTNPRKITASSWDNPMYFYWENGYAGPGFYTDWVITGGVAAHGTPPHPVHIQTLENFDVAGHISRLASQL